MYNYNDHCFHTSSETADWGTARERCLARGRDLVTIESSAEQATHRNKAITVLGRQYTMSSKYMYICAI